MNEAFLENLTFANVAAALWRHKFKSLLFGLIFLALAVAALLIFPKKYQSSGKMFVQLGRGNVTLDPTATTGKNILVQESRESEINSVVDILQSRGILELIVGTENIEEEILESKSPLKDWIPKFSLGPQLTDEQKELKRRDKAIRKLAKAVSIRAPRKASVITVSCKTESPDLSSKIVRVIMDTYLKEHVKARQTAGSFSFFKTAYDESRVKVEKYSTDIEKYKNEIGVMSIQGRQGALRDHIAGIETALLKANARYTGFSSQLAELQKLSPSVPATIEIESTAGVANQGFDLMKDRLFSLQVEEKDLLVRLGPNNPQVRAKRQQVAQAESELNTQRTDRKEVRRGINLNRQQLDFTMMKTQAGSKSWLAQVNKLTSELAKSKAEMAKLNQYDTELGRLGRDLVVAEKSFKTYADKLEEARINRALDLQNISNVKIVQPATAQLKHVSPNYPLVLAASLLFSFIGAVCLAIFAEQMDTSLKTDQQVEDALGVDVLSSIPPVGHRNVHVA